MDIYVISVRKDICSAVSHIRVNFPGADASQHGDLFILWAFGQERFCTVLFAQLMGTQASEKYFIFILGAVAFGSCGTFT